MTKLGKAFIAGILALLVACSSGAVVFAQGISMSVGWSPEAQASGVIVDTTTIEASVYSILEENSWMQAAAEDGVSLTIDMVNPGAPGLMGQLMLRNWQQENDPDGNIVFQADEQNPFSAIQIGIHVQVGTAVDENVTNAPTPFVISVPIPEGMRGKQGYRVAEVRSDGVNWIDSVVDGDALTFPVARFKDTSSVSSTTNTGVYVLAYTKTHQVIFDSKGGSAVETAEAVHGSPVSQPENPIKEGYTFKGWSASETAFTAYDFASPVQADLTLYAFWTKEASSTPSIPGGSSSGLHWDGLLSGSDAVTGKANPATGGVLPLPALLLAGGALCVVVLTVTKPRRK